MLVGRVDRRFSGLLGKDPPQSVSVCGPSAPPCPAPRRHVSSLLSFTASVTTSGSRVHGARPRPPPLCYFKRSSASWVLECLSRACLATYGVTTARKDYNSQSAPGARQSIRLQHMGVGGCGPAPSSLWDWSNWDSSTSCVCLLQDLKEKKLLEEKENGKDSATNGKVARPPFPVAASGAGGSSGV